MPSAKKERLGDLVEKLPARFGGDEAALAYLDSAGEVEDSVTYRQLRERSRTAASRLGPLAKPGAVAVILVPDGLEFVEAFFGCVMAGLVPAPLRPPRHKRDETAFRLLHGSLQQTDAPILIAAKPHLELVNRSELLREFLDSGRIRPVPLEELRSGLPTDEPVKPFPMPDPNQAAYLQYTSGSTLNPRGVVLTHRNVIANLEYMSHTFGHDVPYRGACWLPLSHDMGLVGQVMTTLFEGGFTVLMSPSTFLRDPAVWLRAFGRFEANRCPTTPFALDYCVSKRVFEDPAIDLSGWKYAYVGAETVFSETLDRFAEAFRVRGFRRTTFCPSYGLAEATLMAAGGCEDESVWSPRRFRNGSPPSAYPLIGYKVNPAFVDVRIVDPSSKKPLSSGEIGEVWITGDSVSSAYFNQPELSTEALQARLPGEEKAFARTGDLGTLADGRLYLSGRLKDLVIFRGVNFASDDLEYTVGNSHEEIRFMDACCCFSVVENAEERLVVVQEIERHLPPAVRDEILTAARGALLEEHGLAASRILLIPAGTMTRTANGKIARSRCRERVLEGGFTRLASWPDSIREVSPETSHQTAPAAQDDPVVVIGMACRFPGGADSPEALWKLLVEGGDAIVETPPERWNNDLFFDPQPAVPQKMNTRWGGFLQEIAQFDPVFFGISPGEATEIDPQQRMLLETSWRLFENAGLTLERLKGSDTGVYVGLSTNDYLYLKIKLTAGMGGFNAYSGLGNANSIAANRLSYLFDLRGPSLTVDTACSSSLTALHLAAESVRRGECSMAITGGVNAILTPGPTIALSQFGMMAPDGRCKVFDERADGYVRSEGCGLIMLKRKSDALRDGDRILACVLGSAIGQDGRTQGITMPGEDSQRELIERTIRIAGIDPAGIGYVEAHGTGTAAGDPVEVTQLKATYGQAGSRPCYVGSVKANLGHLESAAGIASVIKTLLVLRHGLIPPQIHLRRLNPRIDLRQSRLEIPDALREWRDTGGPRRAAVSSFGFGGANAHLILEGFQDSAAAGIEGVNGADKPAAQICPLSWKSAAAAPPSIKDWTTWLRSNSEASLECVCHWLATRRTHFSRRVAVVASSRAELIQGLEGCAGRLIEDTSPPVLTAFLFPGQGEAYAGMGRELYDRYPVFRQALDRCAATFDGICPEGPGLAASILDGRAPAGTAASIHDQTHLFAVEYALAQLWSSWGIRPDALLGHSLGEYAAACVAGCFEPEDGVRLLIERSRLVDSVTVRGAMAVVSAGEADLRDWIESSGLSIAAINSPLKTVLAGEADAVAAAVAELNERGLDSRLLPVRQAFHSSLLDEIVDQFEKAARSVQYRAPQLTWISSLTGARMTEAPDAHHWRDHLRYCVRYADGVRTLDQLGCSAYIQIGPGAALLPLVWEVTGRRDGLLLKSLKREPRRGEAQVALEALGRLYERGVNPNWEKVFAQTDGFASPPESMPGHPFLKERFWLANVHPDRFAAFVDDPEVEPAKPGPPQTAAETAERPWMYEVEWKLCPFKRKRILTPASETQVHVANWIIVGGEGQLAGQLSRVLQAAGFSTYLVQRDLKAGAKGFFKSVPGGKDGARRFSVSRACGIADYLAVLRHIVTEVSPEGATTWRLVYLGGVDAGATETLTVPMLEEHQNVNGVGDALRLTKAVLEMNLVIPMWIVTRNAQWLRPEDGPDNATKLNVAQAPLWGFGKSLYLENPELRGGLIDIDDSDEATLALQAAGQVSEPEGEHCVAFRGDQRFLPRLVRVAAEPAKTILRSDGVYCVTGGLGGLGLRCAGWLAKRGARDLVLIGRSPFPDKETWPGLAVDHPDHPKVEALREIESLGAEVEIVSMDVRDLDRIKGLFEGLRSEGRPIRGVIHAAGVNWLGKIRDIDAGEFLDTIRIKVSASWALHELTREEDLDLFLLFSSVSALWGSVDLSHYTTANHFMDVLSCYRAGQGLPSLSVQWGPWAEVGMSAKEKELAVFSRLGLRPMPPDDAILALEASLSRGRPLSLLADIEWKKFQPFIDFSLSPSLFSQLSSTNAELNRGQETRQKLRDIHAKHPEQARSLLDGITRKALASVLLVDSSKPLDAETRFNFMGMDSLMAIAFAAELERVLNIKIPNTLAYNYPTIRAVVEHIYQELLGEPAPPAPPRADDSPEAPIAPHPEPVSPTHKAGQPDLFRVQPSRAASSSPRLFCFPYAGAGASVYGTWNERLSDCCELVLVQFPGREDLSDVPPLRSVKALALLLASFEPSRPDRPFVFFGHSLGALVAFELTMELRRSGRPLPQHLILSGRDLPSAEAEAQIPVHRQPDIEFLDAVMKSDIGGELSAERRKIAHAMLPLLRADVEMVETYELPNEEPIECPLTVFAGSCDPFTCRDGLMGWHAMTRGDFFLRQFSGGHDFVKGCEAEVLESIKEILN